MEGLDILVTRSRGDAEKKQSPSASPRLRVNPFP